MIELEVEEYKKDLGLSWDFSISIYIKYSLLK